MLQISRVVTDRLQQTSHQQEDETLQPVLSSPNWLLYIKAGILTETENVVL